MKQLQVLMSSALSPALTALSLPAAVEVLLCRVFPHSLHRRECGCQRAK